MMASQELKPKATGLWKTATLICNGADESSGPWLRACRDEPARETGLGLMDRQYWRLLLS
jgi:hypothetical protein